MEIKRSEEPGFRSGRKIYWQEDERMGLMSVEETSILANY
jgi:hypothetical protein